MRSDREQSALVDILHNIALAEDFIRDLTFETFCDDLMRVYAVTRCLEIISEASRRLTDVLKRRHRTLYGARWREPETCIAMTTNMSPLLEYGTPCGSPCRRCVRLSSRN
jgi:Protein of unknown function DUF86